MEPLIRERPTIRYGWECPDCGLTSAATYQTQPAAAAAFASWHRPFCGQDRVPQV